MIVFGIFLGLIILVLLVVAHELGHAIAARRNGVVVEEFGIGFPPKAWGKKLKNGILFTVNWLPLGGFVKLQGENDSATKKGDYGAASFWAKTKILFAGVVMNWLVAALLLTVLAWAGLPKVFANQFTVPSDTQMLVKPVELTAINKGSAAEKNGYKKGDRIFFIDGQSIPDVERMIALTKERAGKEVTIVSERAGTRTKKTLTLGTDQKSGIFGANLGQRQEIKATWSAPLVGVATTAQFTWETLKGTGILLKDFVTGIVYQLSFDKATREQGGENLDRAGSQVAGPVGILGVIFPAAGEAGPKYVLFLAAIISLTLAVINTLPIPALDGGRWFVTALFKLLKRPLTKEREEKIHGTGFMIWLVLIVIVTFADIKKLL